jgi:hypothetical protein
VGGSVASHQLAELVVVEKKIKTLTKELKAMVLASGSRLMDLPGVSDRSSPPGSWPTSVTSPGSPTGTGSRPGPAPRLWTPPQAIRSGTGCRGPGTGR